MNNESSKERNHHIKENLRVVETGRDGYILGIPTIIQDVFFSTVHSLISTIQETKRTHNSIIKQHSQSNSASGIKDFMVLKAEEENERVDQEIAALLMLLKYSPTLYEPRYNELIQQHMSTLISSNTRLLEQTGAYMTLYIPFPLHEAWINGLTRCNHHLKVIIDKTKSVYQDGLKRQKNNPPEGINDLLDYMVSDIKKNQLLRERAIEMEIIKTLVNLDEQK